ncbi:MAG: PhoH family protein [Tissierella sp.]|uniref:PhoH family protein n=1 Tax=Tissierella sp. TaxID=41274 RepID=UPI003F9B2E73
MENNIREKEIIIENNNIVNEIFGRLDENVNIIKEKLNINILLRDGKVKLIGESENINLGEKLIYDLIDIIKSQKRLNKHDLLYSINLVLNGEEGRISELLNEIIMVTASGKTLKPKTLGQKRYLNAIKKKDIVFGVGPAGTGKTYLAMAMAIRAFKNKKVDRIILTRPAVEAGESLGFLPGDLQEKVDPYLRPVYDALFDIMGADHYLKYLEKGLIEVAPLAYMRGRTLDNSYVILDEAQNTTNEQMKMFLTRIGFGSKAIITGDITQIDLPRGKESGLKNAAHVLKDIEGIDIVHLSPIDIVRHPLVQKIVVAYEKHESDK